METAFFAVISDIPRLAQTELQLEFMGSQEKKIKRAAVTSPRGMPRLMPHTALTFPLKTLL